MKKIISILLLLLLIACTSGPTAELGDAKVNLELAATPSERAKGLMHRESLGENDGMLFVFEKESILGFWMKNTLISLDMIFIDSNNKIVDIMTAVPCEKDPCKSYTPQAESKYVLEVNAGFAEKHNIQIGDEIKLNI
ncbi:DUF192 domain-containing protein [Candidatus Woesearchaeota archaeon]|nr:DUF192 domain-containing protein [Candidatus Woesearchaeota archaeon]